MKAQTLPSLGPLKLDPGTLPSAHGALYDAILHAEANDRWHEAEHLRLVWEAMCPLVPSGALVFRSEVWAEIVERARQSDGPWQVRHQLRQVQPGTPPHGPLAVRIDCHTWRTEVDYRRGTPMLHALGAAMRLCAPPPPAITAASPSSRSNISGPEAEAALRLEVSSAEPPSAFPRSARI